jgi:hypothetical protein
MGGIDCDPASSEIANETVKAGTFYTVEDNGLAQEWGGNVFLNPPYSQPLVAHFCDKLLLEIGSGNVHQACVLVNNATDTVWCQGLLEACSAVCLLRGRVRFTGPEGEKGAPLQGQILLYFGSGFEGFAKEASAKGVVLFNGI